MRLDLARASARLTSVTLSGWVRIIPAAHVATPTGTGPGASRFSSATFGFTVLYAACDFATAFAEAVVRDRFVGKRRRYLYRPHLDGLRATEINTTTELKLLDFLGAAAYELGIDTDAKGARDHRAGQRFSDAVHAEIPAADGILFASRLTGQPCVAVYDRALIRLQGSTPLSLDRVAAFHREIKAQNIAIRRRRGLGS